jgi:hypothetical protein
MHPPLALLLLLLLHRWLLSMEQGSAHAATGSRQAARGGCHPACTAA